jgi:hypothetical protein
MIRIMDFDTTEPLNVYDWELTRDMTNLPLSRPLSQETPMAYSVFDCQTSDLTSHASNSRFC